MTTWRPSCSDPCPSPSDRASGGTGATPADLAAKLRSATGYSASEPLDGILAGFHGKRLMLQIPDSLDDCHQTNGLPLWIGRPTGFGSPSQRSTLWILDVEGKRVMIEAVSFPGTSAEDLAAQQQLIDSIRIELVKPAPTTPATKQGFIDSIDGLRITFDVPDGWASNGSGASQRGRSVARYRRRCVVRHRGARLAIPVSDATPLEQVAGRDHAGRSRREVPVGPGLHVDETGRRPPGRLCREETAAPDAGEHGRLLRQDVLVHALDR